MWLDSIDDLDSWEVGSQARETSEQQQERKDNFKKWLAWIKRTQKDEKKAKKDNDFLFDIIVEILRDKKYDILIPFIVELLEIWAPSNFIIWAVSLIYDKANILIKKNYSWVENEKALTKLEYKKTNEMIEFKEETLDITLRNRINEWIEDIYSVVSNDPSTIISKRFLTHTSKKEKEKYINLMVAILTFFFYDLNIVIQKNIAFKYSEFILGEIRKKVEKLELEEV